MRLRIATAFACLLFVVLAGVLIRVSRVMPESQLKPVQKASFSFDLDGIDGEAAFDILSDFLDISPRNSGTQGAEKAADFISARLKETGLLPNTDVFEDATPKGTTTFRNVTATIEGRGNSCLVLISHYDTKSGMPKGFTGANDSGSSTALLLHMASVMKMSTSTVPDIVFAFVDGEECMKNYSGNDGLHGSRRLAQTLSGKYGAKNISAVIVLDMIGDKDLTVTVPQNSSPELVKRLFDAARAEQARDHLTLFGPILDDHVPFLEMGVPAIDIIDFHYGSAPRRNDYWHTAEDSIDKISPESLNLIGRITLRLANSIIREPLDD